MRSYHLTKEGEGFTLQLREHPLPQPGPGQVRVRVRAGALNYRDLLVRQGRYGSRVEGLVPLSDGAGDVEADGETRGGPHRRGGRKSRKIPALPGQRRTLRQGGHRNLTGSKSIDQNQMRHR